MNPPRIRIGNAPVSWGVYEADRPNPPFARVLDDIAAAGYEGTELGPYGYLPTTPDALAAELRKRKLGLGSSFVPLPLENPARRAASVDAALPSAGLGRRAWGVIIADDEDPRRTSGSRTGSEGRQRVLNDAHARAGTTLNTVAASSAILACWCRPHHAGTFV